MNLSSHIKQIEVKAPRDLGPIGLSYQFFGQDPKTHPVVMVNHALTGDAQVTGPEGWWNRFVGPNKTINTERFAIISFNIPGNGVLNSQLANYSDFHTGDIAHIFWEGLQNLGIEKLFALIGGSIGGCIGWEFMAKFGDCVERFIPVATDWKASDWLIANTYLQDQILKNSSNPVHDARLHAMLCYRSPQSFADRFLRTFNEEENLFNVETWLRHHGEKLRKRFSTHSYLVVNHLLRSVNTERSGRPLEEIFSNSSTQFYLVGIDTDLFFIPSEIKETYERLKTAGVAISYLEIQSPHGHDAFLIEYQQMEHLLKPIFQIK